MKFDSLLEQEYAFRLELLKRAREIRGWKRLPSKSKNFPLVVDGHHICYHSPDFLVELNNGEIEAHEIKGWNKSIREWKLKRKLFRVCYPEIEYRTMTKKRGSWVPWPYGKRSIAQRIKTNGGIR